ncbi:hypothetical protein N782_15925 [Pontibacillus yanchengensis Y32]|uniref:Uncharacterized protein n=1 Tax=Pontibacillus yanchengensis Y32 TaxID=1385514 RepID=A0A0A2TCU0_9BACI|nr:hypothetical protein N782_15925 [Pontibacillus yanchengensis Y32]
MRDPTERRSRTRRLACSSAESEPFHRSPFLIKGTGPASPVIKNYGVYMEEHKTILLLYQQKTLTQPVKKEKQFM